VPALGAALAALTLLGASGARSEAARAAAACPNEIVCENEKEGNAADEWDVDGAGDPTIVGFATDMSVDQGARVRFKVRTSAPAYRIDIYRLGWYGGDGARKVATVTPSAELPQTQPDCLTVPSSGLVDCGNWSESASWAVPGDAVSGIYIGRLVRLDTLGASHVIFVVRDDDGASDLLVQTSDTTWQAYNRYGGNSLYIGSPAGRAYKVSYNRPLTMREYANPSFLFSGEIPMVRFLERNGYDVSYFTGVDSDRLGSEILEHRAFLSVGHDEYWSGGQRANVEAARAAGVSLGFFSGNEVFWKTRWETSIDGSGASHRTLVSYKETKPGAKIDPDPAWTGTWMDPRFSPPADGGRPQNSLTGTLFTVNAYREDAMTIPADYGTLRFWRHTSVADLAPGQVATVGAGILGHEWDEDVDNGFRPAGAFALSATTLGVEKHLIDYGNTFVPGDATHQLMLYRHASGALVFGAGTVQYAWALDSDHDYFLSSTPRLAPDPRIQQATVNLFADMGAQPGSLQANLVAASASTDDVAPTSAITSPADGTAVAGGSPVTVTGTAVDGGGVVAGVEVSTDGGATWHRATGRTNWTYTFAVGGFGQYGVKSRAVDDSGNLETASSGITIAVSCPCTLWAPTTVPATAATSDTKAVELGVKFTADSAGFVNGIRFFKGAGNTGVHVGSLWSSTGTLLARATFTSETAGGWQQVNFDAPVPVSAGTTYVASYYAPAGRYALNFNYFNLPFANAPLRAPAGTNGVYRYANGPVFPNLSNGASNYWVDVVYDTQIRPDGVAPTITGLSPAEGATGAESRGDITATFTEALDAATVTGATFSLRNSTGSLVPASVGWDGPARRAVLTTSTALAPDATYTATVRGGAGGMADRSGNVLAESRSWSFTTAPPRSCPCGLWSASALPAVAASSDTKAVELGLKFTVDSTGYVSGIRFYKGPGNGGTHVGSLWTSTGALLARATFAGETATGWQEVSFDTPVAVEADTTYVASYYAPVGRYSLNVDYFSAAYANAPIRALRDGVQGGNGVFRYNGVPVFPNQTNLASNYWVDVVYNTILPPDTTAPAVVDLRPADGSTNADNRGDVTATFSEPLDPATVTTSNIELRDGGGSLVPAVVAWDGPNRRVVLSPSVPLAHASLYRATVEGGQAGVADRAGNHLVADRSWTFTTGAARTCPCSLWESTARPGVESSTDTKAVEVGVKFAPDADGVVTGVRFFKGALNTGTHVGSLWTASGSLLGRVTFTAETASGWQTATFPSPIAVTADTTYVISYFAPVGRYSLDLNAFGTGYANAPLRVLRDGLQGGNGIYRYGAAPSFPNQAFQASNYWVDLVYQPT
jgi:hypothetical protein